MKLISLVASTVTVGCVTITIVVSIGSFARDPSSPSLAERKLSTPDLGVSLSAPDGFVTRQPEQPQNPASFTKAPMLVAAGTADVNPTSVKKRFRTWSHEIASGETLDAVLADAGLAISDRAKAARALGTEYDPRRLRPGHVVTVVTTSDGALRRVNLNVDDGVVIEAVFGERLTTRVSIPEPEIVPRARELVIETSIFAALDRADVPARFAIDLAQMLGGEVDFRRDFSGGESLQLLWREARANDEIVGQPEINFAALDLGDVFYEVVWPKDGSGRATIYRDGEVIRVFAQPVEGARLSSVFGRRRHPVYGDVRMHTGVDFAAARGEPVYATAPGRVSFIGRRSGYGRIVEIAHGADTMTRYAHLRNVPNELAVDDRLLAGDIIGYVGATGTATGPNLHYEVRVNGRATDPLLDDRLAKAIDAKMSDTAAMQKLKEARALLTARLPARANGTTSESI